MDDPIVVLYDHYLTVGNEEITLNQNTLCLIVLKLYRAPSFLNNIGA